MGDYSNEIAALIGSLKNPRYATQDQPAVAPVLFDGELQSQFVTFVAHPDDPHDYGVEVWNNAQAGEYGPIAPYTPFPELPSTSPPSDSLSGNTVQPIVETYFYSCVRQVVATVAEAQLFNQAARALTANGGKMPSGARGKVITQLAASKGLSPDDLAALLLALDDLQFTFLAARSAYQGTGDMKQFAVTMAEALEEFNAASPLKIEAPQ